jgi:hypothetical protein
VAVAAAAVATVVVAAVAVAVAMAVVAVERKCEVQQAMATAESRRSAGSRGSKHCSQFNSLQPTLMNPSHQSNLITNSTLDIPLTQLYTSISIPRFFLKELAASAFHTISTLTPLSTALTLCLHSYHPLQLSEGVRCFGFLANDYHNGE